MSINYWLMKSEPDVWSIDQQKKAGAKGAAWDGVRNYQAANNLKKMKRGDLSFFYHSNIGKEIVGIVEVIKNSPEMDRRRLVQPRPHATYQPDLNPVAVAEAGCIAEAPVCRAAYRAAVHLINLDHPGTASRFVAFFLQPVLRKPLGALHVVVRAQPLHQRIQVL